jgi:hypothetical protein
MTVVVGVAAMALGLAGLVVSAGMSQHYVHMAIAAAVSLLIAIQALSEARAARDKGPGAVASVYARHSGLIYAWGAAGLVLTYTTVLAWREWWHFFIAFFSVAGLCLFFAATLAKDAAAGKDDPAMLALSRKLSWLQLVAMLGVVVGLLVDGKMTRFLVPRYTDWAANNIFFFGAIGLAAIAWAAVREPAVPTAPARKDGDEQGG